MTTVKYSTELISYQHITLIRDDMLLNLLSDFPCHLIVNIEIDMS